MDQLNRIQLRGYIGSIRLTEFDGKTVAAFTVATNLAYKDRQGCAVIETTWHHAQAFQSDGISGETLRSLSKGDAVSLTGRLRNQRYAREDGTEVCNTEIRVQNLQKLDLSGGFLQYEM